MNHKRLRIVVEKWTDSEIHGHTDSTGQPADVPQEVVVADSELPRPWLYEGAQLNLLLTETEADGRLRPQHIVLEPDFLVDVTAICRCATECGDAPAHHLLQKFLPHPTTAAIQLGAVANQFLDDVANDTAATPDDDLYRRSLRKSFADDPLRFSTVDGIDAAFAVRCRQQFDHIRRTLKEHPVEGARLETAFYCEALGIQGRMDLMSGDARTIVELKSGKGAYTGKPDLVAYRYEHALQMALYKESLYYNVNLPYAQVQTLLFYSLYPALLDIHLGRNDIHRAVALRNGIVHLERLLRTNPGDVFRRLSVADFNPAGRNDRFFTNYVLPPIQRLLNTLRQADPLARCYFLTMVAFVEREQDLAKRGVEGSDLPPGRHGFADVWRTDVAARLEAGNLIRALVLTAEDIEKNEENVLLRLHFHTQDPPAATTPDADTPTDDSGLTASNFRPGDLVMLHPEGRSSFYFPCIIEEMNAHGLVLRLRYPQRDASALDLHRHFVVEPTHADATYSTLYQGLFALLEAPAQRRQLLLGQRPPRTDSSRSLALPIADAELRDLVLRAKQAQDYFLLVGPPGAGKTNIALRQLVVEFLAGNPPAPPSAPSQPALLLTAFTNRAVDEICQMLESIDPQPDYVRIGPEWSAAPQHRAHTLTALSRRQPTRAAVRTLLARTRIVVGTIASLCGQQELFLLKHFPVAIVDEASQVLEPQLLPLMCAQQKGQPCIGKFIFIGDHKQLPAVVAQSPETSQVHDESLRAIGLTDCRHSLFERLHRLALRQGTTQVLGMLHRQGRMHRDICRFASRQYYGGQLDIVPLPHQTGPLDWSPGAADDALQQALASHRLLCFDTRFPAEADRKYNSREADLAARIVEAVAELCHRRQEPYNWSRRLGIIVPFRAQIQRLRSALARLDVPEAEEIDIDTVERYQGSQRDIILFSTVVGSAWQLPILSAPVETDGQLIDRKLNVAITRARHQFLLLGDLQLLASCPPYRQLIDYIRESATGEI